MNARKFAFLLVLSLLPQIQNAGPLDTWTWRNPLPTGNTLLGVVYGNGLFVAVGDSGTIITPLNAIDWTLRAEGIEGSDYILSAKDLRHALEPGKDWIWYKPLSR
jgi:hypothetical protein